MALLWLGWRVPCGLSAQVARVVLCRDYLVFFLPGRATDCCAYIESYGLRCSCVPLAMHVDLPRLWDFAAKPLRFPVYLPAA